MVRLWRSLEPVSYTPLYREELMAKKPGIKLIANNKKAFHDYFIEDTYEAGIALAGTEVKSPVSYTHLDVYKRQVSDRN